MYGIISLLDVKVGERYSLKVGVKVEIFLQPHQLGGVFSVFVNQTHDQPYWTISPPFHWTPQTVGNHVVGKRRW